MIQPILDRVLVRLISDENESAIATPEAFQERKHAEVVALGQKVVLGGQAFPLTDFLSVGDKVRVSEYSIEKVEGDLYLTRIQEIRGIEKANGRKR